MAGIEVRKLTLADREDADEILRKSFAGISPYGIVEREVTLAPETCWIAIAGGVPAGLVCAIQYDQISYIGPMAVTPESRGKGIGRLLFGCLVESLESRGCLTMMLDATEAGEPLYRKFGFVEWSRTFDMGREPGPGIATPAYLSQLDWVVEMDRVLFTAGRAPVFRRLLEREGAALYSSGAGFLVAQTKVVGPFAAYDRGAAADLLDLALSDGAVASRVLAPVENLQAERVLVGRGFQVQREVKHMRRGQPVAMRRDLMYGLASFALG